MYLKTELTWGPVFKINISSPGIYVLDRRSAVGKSFLYRAIKERGSQFGFISIDYTDYKNFGMEAIMLILNQSGKQLILIDDYDLFEGALDNWLNSHESPDNIILLDYKKDDLRCVDNIVFMEYTTIVEVFD